MCGIAGIINFNIAKQHVNALMSMTHSLINRGPDDEGYMLFNDQAASYVGHDSLEKKSEHIKASIAGEFKVGFGFRQLKIIDLSNKSHQPMCDLMKRYWIIHNGEVYNFREVRIELEKLGYTFFSDSDTEVVLNSYIEWKEKALEKFNGMFAFCILDTLKNEIFIARDRIGIKPLYFYQNPQHFIFASTIKAIIRSGLYHPQISWRGLAQNFRFSIAQSPDTSFQDINSLEPAHYLKIDLKNNTIKKIRYWEIPIQTQDTSLTEKSSLTLLEESLKSAINYRLISDVEAGTFMSGGIDSTLVSVLASKKNPNIKVQTLGFTGYKELDEVTQASDTAKLQNLNHLITYVNATDVLKNIEQSVIAYEEPYFHLSANFELAKMAASNKVKVVLSGLGGDELFGGYDVYNKLSLWNTLKKYRSFVNLLPNFHESIKKGKQLAGYHTFDEFYAHYYTNYTNDDINRLFNNTYNTTAIFKNLHPDKGSFADAFEAMSFFNLKSYIGNHQMRAVDRSTMAFSIEGRFPLLDHHFIETAFKIPTKFKLTNTSQKYALKKIAEKYIAPSCLKMNKKGLSLPLSQWISKDLKGFVADTLHALKNRHIFDNRFLEAVVKSNNETKIWQLVSTELWLQNFIDAQ